MRKIPQWVKKRLRTERRWTGPIILPRAVHVFRKRELWSYTWLKQIPRKELLANIREPKFKFHTKPRDCQLVGFTIGTMVPDFLFFLDMGAGKSKLALDALWYRRLVDGLGRILVLSPGEVNVLTWADEIKKHRPEFKYEALVGTKDERFERLLEGGAAADIYLLTYDGLMSFITKLGGKKDGGREIDHKMAKAFGELFDAVVLDETHLVGHRRSLRWRMCNAVMKHARVRFGMSGTPFGRDPEMLWSQFNLIDRGATLGETLGMFRAAFFKATVNEWSGGFNYTFDDRYTTLLHDTLNNRSIRYEDHEFTDMPAINYIKHRLTFGKDAEAYYKQVRDELRAAKGNLLEMENAFLRMRQVCSGFLTLRGEDDEKHRIPFYTNPKLEALEVLLDSLPWDEKVIVFHEFILSGNSILAMLDRKKIKYARIGGAHSRPSISLRRFLNNRDCRVFIVNNHSSATAGINPQSVCRREVFYDSPISPIVRKQAEKRVHRMGQEKHVFIHDLVIAGGTDDLVLGFIEQGKNLFDAIINGEVKV